MVNQNNYSQSDIITCETYLSPAVHTKQLTEPARNEMLKALRLHLQSKTSKEKEEYLTVKEVCQKLKISKPTLYKLIKEGVIRKRKIRRSTRILASDIKKYLEGQIG
jgi:excisionase family DNA binding protein